MGTVVISPSAISNLPKGGAIKGLSASSNVFVAKIKIPDDKSWSGATKEEPVFLLNNQDFIDLQLYINSALKLPGSTALFKSTYTKKSFDPYFGSDPSLYDAMATKLPELHQHCLMAQGEIIGPMISLAGYIANFAGAATENTAKLKEHLNVLTNENADMSSTEFKMAKARARSVVTKLKTYAENAKTECAATVTRLQKFRADTIADKNAVDDIKRRLTPLLPDEKARKSKLKELIDLANAAWKAAQSEIESTKKEMAAKGQFKWYHYIPVIGVCILIYDTIKMRGLMNTLNNLNRKFNDEKTKATNQEAELMTAAAQVTGFAHCFDSITNTIDAAIVSIGKMSSAFSKLETSFGDLHLKIGFIDGKIDLETWEDRVIALDDLTEAEKAWGKILPLAQQFQNNGVLVPSDKDGKLKERLNKGTSDSANG